MMQLATSDRLECADVCSNRTHMATHAHTGHSTQQHHTHNELRGKKTMALGNLNFMCW